MKGIHKAIVVLVILAGGLAIGVGVVSSLSSAPAAASCYGC
jgi:hypothetical protein